MRSFQRFQGSYDGMTPSGKAAVRNFLQTDVQSAYLTMDEAMAMMASVIARLDEIQAFVQTRQADFNRAHLVTERNRILDRMVTAVNAVNGVSASRP
jgi:hypothetical protein